MQEFIPVETARGLVLAAVPAQPEEERPLADALGATLARPVVSRDAIPPFDNSAMDGFAVRTADFADGTAVLRVIDDIPAGTVPQRTVEPGTCARIMTGAPFPDGADAVAPMEWTADAGDGHVSFPRAPARGQHVRRAGRDVAAGATVLEAGTVVTPPVVGMLATLGQGRVAVRRPPTVAVVATGDELVAPETAELRPGQIRNASGPALAAQVRRAGGVPLPPLLARDTRRSIRAVLEEALAADVLVFAGGVSVGDYDLVKQVLDAHGMTLAFWKVRQRPGKPLAFGELQGKPVFGLPGNPVSSALCFDQYVRPALARMLGRREVLRPRHPAVLEADTPKAPGLHTFARGIARFGDDGRLVVRDTGPQASNLYSSVVQANCLVHLPADLEAAPAGTPVEVEWLAW